MLDYLLSNLNLGAQMKSKIVFALIIVCLLTTLVVDAQTKHRRTSRPAPKPAAKSAAAGVTTPSGLTYLITKKGTGAQLKTSDIVVLNYTGTLTTGEKFDSSFDRNQPFSFKLGAGQVIKGWDEGVSKLHVGDQAIIVIPGNLAYGPKGIPNVIPPDATLIFVIEVLDVKGAALSDLLSKTLSEKGVEAMIAEYHRVKTAGDPSIYISESDINTFGYTLLRKRQVSEAIEVLKLNVEAYPQSPNVYDSLGEAYAIQGDKEKAIENYQRVLALDPTAENAKRMLKRLTGQ